jgi:hypothetical protein
VADHARIPVPDDHDFPAEFRQELAHDRLGLGSLDDLGLRPARDKRQSALVGINLK